VPSGVAWRTTLTLSFIVFLSCFFGCYDGATVFFLLSFFFFLFSITAATAYWDIYVREKTADTILAGGTMAGEFTGMYVGCCCYGGKKWMMVVVVFRFVVPVLTTTAHGFLSIIITPVVNNNIASHQQQPV
jgi:hypothetical protein